LRTGPAGDSTNRARTNPAFRNRDNSLPTSVDLSGHVTTGDFGPAGQPLGIGDAVRGLALYTGGLLDDPFHCSNCHTLPTGMAANGPLQVGDTFISAGGALLPLGPNGENHLGIVSVDGSTNISLKVPQLRNMYDKIGMESQQPESRAGFGFLHDGSIDSLARFMTEDAFELGSDQDVADLVALMLAFSGSDLADPALGVPDSLDTHAAVGTQLTLRSGAANADFQQLVGLAGAGAIDLASAQRPLTVTAVPAGLGRRLGIDRDGDGLADRVELSQGSSPADAAAVVLAPEQGLWFNPDRNGHGFDLEVLGDNLFITWYTYEDDGTPVWYQAAGPFDRAAGTWSADFRRFVWLAGGGVDSEVVGSAALTFDDASHARFDWTLEGGARSGSEPMQVLAISLDRTLRDYTGTWYDPADGGWGVSFYSRGDVRVAVLYFYDADRQPRWALGQSDNAMDSVMPMLSFTGFCPDCTAVPVDSVAAGDLVVTFSDERGGVLTSTVAYPGLAASAWPRSEVQIIPLSDPWRDPRKD